MKYFTQIGVLLIVILSLMFTTSKVNAQSRSLYFDGTAGNQSVVAKGFKSLEGVVDSVYTQEFWVKPDSFLASWGEQHLMDFVGAYHSQLFLKTENADTSWLYTQDGNASWHNNLPVVRGQWTHVAYVRDGVSDSAYIYVNGQLASTEPLDHQYPTNLDSNLVIGLYPGYESGESCYSGLMDEVRIWNKALSQADIQDVMVKELNGDEDGLLTYYNFNNQSGDALHDVTSNGLDGVLKNMDEANWKTEGAPVTPLHSKSLYFSGEVGTQKIVAKGFSGLVDSVYTQELWIKPDNFNLAKYGECHLMQFKSVNGESQLFLVKINSDSAYVKTVDYNLSMEQGGVAVLLHEWTHIAYVRDGVDSLANLYINGQLVSSVPLSGRDTRAQDSLVLGIYTGYEQGGTSYSGIMDEVRVWNKALTIDEIRENMVKELTGSEDGLVAYYDFNDQEDGVLKDRTANHLDGILVNMEGSNWQTENTPFTAPGPIITNSKSLYFDGTAGNQNVVAKGFKSLEGVVDSIYTQEFWIKPDAFLASWGEQHLMDFVGAYHSQLFLKTENADTSWLYTQDGNASWHNNLPVVRGQWTHVAYVRDGVSDSAYIYVNGQLASTEPLDHQYPTNLDSNLVIGLYPGYESGESCYSGLMDEVRIWNKALSEEEIQSVMVKKLNGDEDGLLAYYDFDDENVNKLTDRTSNHLDGVLNNMSIFNWSKENTPYNPPTGIEESFQSSIPKTFALKQNYPNPFNPSTTISFDLSKQAHVKITVYNILGEKVADIVNNNMSAGSHRVKFDGSNLSSGVYIYRITAGEFTAVKKMMLLK